MLDIYFIIPSIGRKSLEQTINSLNQLKSKNWNALIIFDDVEPLICFNGHSIHYIKIEKTGIQAKKNNAGLVRNVGLEYILKNNIKTKYIGFCDDDDTLHPDFIEYLNNDIQLFNEPELIIYRMMFPNGNVIPHPLTTKIQMKNVGISFVFKKNLLEKYKLTFINHPYEDYIFVQQAKKNPINILISKYVNYFVKTTFEIQQKSIKNYPPILFENNIKK